MRMAEHLVRGYTIIVMCTDFHGIIYSMFSPRLFSFMDKKTNVS